MARRRLATADNHPTALPGPPVRTVTLMLLALLMLAAGAASVLARRVGDGVTDSLAVDSPWLSRQLQLGFSSGFEQIFHRCDHVVLV